MFKQHVNTTPANHRCPNCGHTFFNTPDNGQCYVCGEQGTDRGEEAGLPDPFHRNDGSYDESGEW